MVFSIETKTHVSAGVILAVKSPSGTKVVLLKQSNEHYERPRSYGEVIDIGPKGGVEEGESLISAAIREAREETGLSSLKLDRKFKTEVKYEFDQPLNNGQKFHVKKRAVYYLAYISEEDVRRIRLSPEHESYELLPIDRAMDRIEPSAATKIDVLKQVKLYIAGSGEAD